MHSTELVRIASLIADRAEALIFVRRSIPAEAMSRYWVAARQRSDLWDRGFDRFIEVDRAGRAVAIRRWWQDHLAMIEEILISEILTRVMAAIGAAIDTGVGYRRSEPLTESVYLSHLEARNRVLRLLLFGRASCVEEAFRLNRLRRCAERWTDFLLGPIGRLHPESARYAIDRRRAGNYGEEAAESTDQGSPPISQRLTSATIEISLAEFCSSAAALPQANRQLAEAVLGCLRPELFDSFGMLKSLTMLRIETGESRECHPGAARCQPLSRRRSNDRLDIR